jgi:hypothetical protein
VAGDQETAMNGRSRIAIVFAAGTLLAGAGAMPGCMSTKDTAAGTSAAFNKVTGNLTTNLSAPLDRVYAATQAALDSLEFRPVDKQKDALQGIVTARMADGDRIVVTLEKRSDKVTGVSVEVGALGKESTARLVLDKIEANLK